MKCRVALAISFIVAFSGSAVAEETTLTPAQQLNLARADIASGRLDDAEKILAAVPEERVDRNDLDFLRGTLAMTRKDYDKAIACFRAVLTRDPSLNRVRLDLARTFFLKGDDAQAEYQFHIAEAAGLPPAVQANVDKILDEIKRRKKWDVNASFGVEPSTNINEATTSQTVNLYGIPYQLSQSAEKTSGVGFVGAVSGSYLFDMTDNSRLVVGGNVNGTDFVQHNTFDDNSAGVFIGPRFLIGDASEITVEATATQRWYGGQDYYVGAGGRVEGKTSLSPQWQLTGAVDIQHLSYQEETEYSGPVSTVSGGVIYGIDAASFIRLDGAVIREQTEEQDLRDTQYFFGPSYYRELPGGYIINPAVNIDSAHYDSPLSAFGVTRHDTTVNYQFGVSNRTINLYGFMPVITYIHTNRYSDIPLYAFTSDRVIIGATQNF